MGSRLPAVLVTAVALLAAPLAAQEPTELSGLITTRIDGLALPGATVEIESLGLGTTSDGEGRYRLTIPDGAARGEVELRVSASGLQPKTQTLTLRAGAMTLDIALSLGFHEEIVVGSRASGTAAEKAVPVDVFSLQQIQTVASTETSQIIQALAPSLNFPRPTITDGTDSVRPATLRGLGPDQVLVLMNGKRRHTSALVHLNNSIGRGSTGVDLNAIPASAIQKVEVLRDGAAAQYGSDAIAGVINIVTKTGKQPLTVSVKGALTLTNPERDVDGDSLVSDGETVDVAASYGFEVGRGSLFLTAEFRDRKETNRAAPDPRDQVGAGDAGNNAVEQPNHHWGDSDATDFMAFLNASIPIDESETRHFYAFGGWSRREGSHGGFYRRSLDARNWPTIYPLGFLPLIEPEVVDGSGTLGVRGSAGRWFWDLSAQYGRNRFDFNVADSLNVSLGPTVPPNQTSFFAGSLILDQIIVNVDFAREVDAGLAGPLNVALGGEFRREGYEIVAGEPASYVSGGAPNQFGGTAAVGAQVFPGFQPSNEVDSSRNSVAGYVDLEANLHSRLRAGVAGRFENYDDFGSTGDGKVTLRLEAHPRFVIRGGFSTGFRAPSLAQRFFSSTATNFLNVPGRGLVPFESLTLPVESPQAEVLGAQPLEAEQSLHFSGGIVWNPVDAFELTADFYRIEIDDRIVLSGNFNQPQVAALLAPFGANSARFFTNAIDTETQGVDLKASYRADLDGGSTLRLEAAYSYTDTEIVGSIATPPQLAGLEATLFDRIERRRIECGQPEDNLRLTGTWTRSRWTAVVRGSRYGKFCSFTATPADDQEFSAEFLADFELSYQRDKLTVGIGAHNVFDTFPDPQIPVNSFNGIFVYPSHSPFGMNGRSLYAKLSVKF